METSEKMLEIIRLHEGFRPTAYRCPAGVWTIGYGHTAGVKAGDRCTREEAAKWLEEDLKPVEDFLNRSGVKLTQQQFDALASFAYNVGLRAFIGSTLWRKVKAEPNDGTIRQEFKKWIYAGGGILKGLVRRREREAAVYAKGDYGNE